MIRSVRSTRTLAGALCVFGACGLVLTGCGSDGGGNGGQLQLSQVRTFNAYQGDPTDSGPLFVGNGSTTLTGQNGLLFGQFSPSAGFSTVAAGSFNGTGTGAGITTPISSQTPINFNANQSYTLAVMGQQNGVGANAPQIVAIPDFNPATTTIPTGQAAVRIVNLSPTAGNLSVFNSNAGAGATAISGLTNVGTGFNALTNQYVFVPVNSTRDLSLRTTANPLQDVTLSGSNLTNFRVQAGEAYTIYTYGSPGNTNFPLGANIATDYRLPR
jgi:hypothetical protein